MHTATHVYFVESLVKGNKMYRKAKVWFVTSAVFVVYLIVFLIAIRWNSDKIVVHSEQDIQNYKSAKEIVSKHPELNKTLNKFLDDDKIDDDELLILRGQQLKITNK